jgi:hypothetical protein
MKDLKYSIPIDVIKVLKERVENAATTIHNCYSLSVWQLSFLCCRRLQYCIICIHSNGGHCGHFLQMISDCSDYFMRI